MRLRMNHWHAASYGGVKSLLSAMLAFQFRSWKHHTASGQQGFLWARSSDKTKPMRKEVTEEQSR